MAMRLPVEWREFVALFIANKVEHVLVGGYAVGYHGYVRATGDLDFLVRPSVANAERILNALNAFGFSSLGLTVNDFLDPEVIIQLGHCPLRIDLLTSITGIDTDEVFREAIETEIDGVPLLVISRAGILTNKRATGRLRDLADVEELETVEGFEPSALATGDEIDEE